MPIQAYTQISAMDGAALEAAGDTNHASDLEHKLGELQTEMVDWKAKYDALATEVDPLREERDELKRQNEEMRLELAKLHEEAATSRSILERIEVKKATSPGGILSPIRS